MKKEFRHFVLWDDSEFKNGVATYKEFCKRVREAYGKEMRIDACIDGVKAKNFPRNLMICDYNLDELSMVAWVDIHYYYKGVKNGIKSTKRFTYRRVNDNIKVRWAR